MLPNIFQVSKGQQLSLVRENNRIRKVPRFPFTFREREQPQSVSLSFLRFHLLSCTAHACCRELVGAPREDGADRGDRRRRSGSPHRSLLLLDPPQPKGHSHFCFPQFPPCVGWGGTKVSPERDGEPNSKLKDWHISRGITTLFDYLQ